MSEAYKAAGVDLAMGDDLSKSLYNASRLTWPSREGAYGEIREAHESFSGLRSWGLKPLLSAPEPHNIEFDQDADGIGTKVEVSQRTNSYDSVAHDLFAMAFDDPAARGFEPVIATTVLDVNRLRPHMRDAMGMLALGMVQAARKARVAIKGGEAAELGDLVGGYGDPEKVLQYNWSATVHAAGHKDRLISGQRIMAGDSLVVLQETGFRSNGLSLVRRTFSDEYGTIWHEMGAPGDKTKNLGQAVLQPSVIYAGALVDMIGGYDLRNRPMAQIHGVAHITGGGIPGKVGRMLEPTGLGAELETPYEPSEAMQLVQSLSGVDDEEVYRVINMGQGMIIASPEPEQVIAVAEQHGILAKEAGTITAGPGILIRSQGVKTPGKKLVYNP